MPKSNFSMDKKKPNLRCSGCFRAGTPVATEECVTQRMAQERKIFILRVAVMGGFLVDGKSWKDIACGDIFFHQISFEYPDCFGALCNLTPRLEFVDEKADFVQFYKANIESNPNFIEGGVLHFVETTYFWDCAINFLKYGCSDIPYLDLSFKNALNHLVFECPFYRTSRGCLVSNCPLRHVRSPCHSPTRRHAARSGPSARTTTASSSQSAATNSTQSTPQSGSSSQSTTANSTQSTPQTGSSSRPQTSPHVPVYSCSKCHVSKPPNHFYDVHVLLDDTRRQCKACVDAEVRESSSHPITFLSCSACHKSKPSQDFSGSQRQKGNKRRCKTCIASVEQSQTLSECSMCHKKLPRDAFSAAQFKKPANSRRCNACMTEKKYMCAACGQSHSVTNFNDLSARRCKNCEANGMWPSFVCSNCHQKFLPSKHDVEQCLIEPVCPDCQVVERSFVCSRCHAKFSTSGIEESVSKPLCEACQAMPALSPDDPPPVKCRRCGREKPRSAFSKTALKSHKKCKECVEIESKKSASSSGIKKKKTKTMSCVGCHRTKPIGEFPKGKREPHVCVQCFADDVIVRRCVVCDEWKSNIVEELGESGICHDCAYGSDYSDEYSDQWESDEESDEESLYSHESEVVAEKSVSTADEYKNCGNELFAKGSYYKAHEMYDRGLQLQPDNHKLLGNRSATHYQIGRYEEAIADAVKSTSIDPKYLRGYTRAAVGQIQLGRFDDAEASFRRLLLQDPRNDTAAGELGRISELRIKYQAVVDYMREFELAVVKRDMCFDDESSASVKSLGAKATKAIAAVIKDISGCPYLKYASEMLHTCMDMECSGAMTLTQRLISCNPQDISALSLRGRACWTDGDANKAADCLGHVMRLDPDCTAVVKLLKKVKKFNTFKNDGNAAFAAGDANEALDRYGEALKLTCDSPALSAVLHCNQAACYSLLNEHAKCIDEATKAIDLDGTYVKAIHRRAQALQALGRHDEAVNDFAKLVDLEPGPESQRRLREAKLDAKKAKRKDYYKILGVSSTATDEELKKGYRAACLKNHPDKNPNDREGAEARFKDVGEAYRILSDAQNRRKYDRGDDVEDIEHGGHRGGPSDMDIFAELFRRGGFGGGPFGFGGFGGDDDYDDYDDRDDDYEYEEDPYW